MFSKDYSAFSNDYPARAVLHDSNSQLSVNALFKARVPFNANGTLQGMRGVVNSFGKLPAEWQDRYVQDASNINYTVISYETPIAWVLTDGTVVKPPVRYSVTTSKHQGRIY